MIYDQLALNARQAVVGTLLKTLTRFGVFGTFDSPLSSVGIKRNHSFETLSKALLICTKHSSLKTEHSISLC